MRDDRTGDTNAAVGEYDVQRRDRLTGAASEPVCKS